MIDLRIADRRFERSTCRKVQQASKVREDNLRGESSSNEQEWENERVQESSRVKNVSDDRVARG